jgi:hypothetical protein
MQTKKYRDLKQEYSIEEFRAANIMERCFIHLLNPDIHELTEAEDQYLEKLRTVWYILTKNLSTKKRVKMICDKIQTHPQHCYYYMRKAQELFGEVLKTREVEELSILKERYYILGDAAAKKEDFEEARKCYQAAEECIMKITALKPAERRTFAAVVFTNNPQVLTQTHDAEDIDFEPVGEETEG